MMSILLLFGSKSAFGLGSYETHLAVSLYIAQRLERVPLEHWSPVGVDHTK